MLKLNIYKASLFPILVTLALRPAPTTTSSWPSTM